MPDIITSAPSFLILACVLAGALIAASLYYRERHSGLREPVRILLGIIRFIAFTLTALLLLNPVVRAWTRTKELPVIVVLNDVSRSVSLGDSTDAAGNSNLGSLLDRMPSDARIVPYHFGDGVGEGLAAGQEGLRTDIGGALAYVSDLYRNTNLGAVVLVSDGINNQGPDPVAEALGIRAPVYVLAEGDTSARLDLRITSTECNRIAFLGRRFPLRVHIRADLAGGENAVLDLVHKGRVLEREPFRITGDDFYMAKTFEVEPDATGIQRYEVRVTKLEGEHNPGNNASYVYVEVLDSRTKVLILADAPHPDITAIRQGITSRQMVDADVRFISEAVPDIHGYNLLILYQLPSVRRSVETLISQARNDGIPVMMVLGASTNTSIFDRQMNAVKVAGPAGKYNLVTPVYDETFSLFHVDEQLIGALPELSPLQAPFGEFTTARDLKVLFTQRIGRVDSEKPLVAFHDMEGWKTGYILGEGIWRWRMDLYRETGGHDAFDELLSSMVQYLALKEQRTRFRVRARNSYLQSDRITMGAEIYNEAYEPVTGKEIALSLLDSSSTAFTYAFSPSGQGYSLDLGYLAPGTYKYRAQTEGLDPVAGAFVVQEVNVEAARLQANHALLREIAASGDGRVLEPGEWDMLPEILSSREDLKPLIYTHQQFTDLKNWPWYLLLVLLLFSVEWVIRRVGGAY